MADEMRVREIIVVEGRDDTAAIKKSVDAVTIETHGYGITERTWKLIEKAYAEQGIIIFTDPDHADKEKAAAAVSQSQGSVPRQERRGKGRRYRNRKRDQRSHKGGSRESSLRR